MLRLHITQYVLLLCGPLWGPPNTLTLPVTETSMKTRFLTIIATLTVLSVTPGCGVLRQFWFGRGARCGNGALTQGPLANLRNRVQQQGQVALPTTGTCQQQPVVAAPGTLAGPNCGCAPAYAGAVCGHESACGLESACGIESYGGVINDPYLNGGIVSGGVVNGGIVDGGIVNGGIVGGEIIGGSIAPGTVIDGGTVIGGPYPSGTGWTPRYQSNRVDTDGAKILSEEPLPHGAVPLN